MPFARVVKESKKNVSMIKNLLQETRSAFKLGAPTTHRNLFVFPLFNGTDSDPIKKCTVAKST